MKKEDMKRELLDHGFAPKQVEAFLGTVTEGQFTTDPFGNRDANNQPSEFNAAQKLVNAFHTWRQAQAA